MFTLTEPQKTQIRRFIPAFRRFLDDETLLLERHGKQQLYGELLAKDALPHLGEFEIAQIVGALWSTRIWGDKRFLVGKLLTDNTIETLAAQLKQVLWDKGEIAVRYETFREHVRGLGTAALTELLVFLHPQRYGLWNETIRHALEILGIEVSRKAQISGTDYETLNEVYVALRQELESCGLTGLDNLDVVYFLYAVQETGKFAAPPEALPTDQSLPAVAADFDHDEVIEQLVAIGQQLGFQAEKEKLVAKGARVDAIWQARFANLGVVTYVFEVQRRGSIDSLVVNLQRAQSNSSVRRLIVVATLDEIERIKAEVATLPESFRKALSFMDVAEITHASGLIGELAVIIGKLDLVRNDFDV